MFLLRASLSETSGLRYRGVWVVKFSGMKCYVTLEFPVSSEASLFDDRAEAVAWSLFLTQVRGHQDEADAISEEVRLQPKDRPILYSCVGTDGGQPEGTINRVFLVQVGVLCYVMQHLTLSLCYPRSRKGDVSNAFGFVCMSVRAHSSKLSLRLTGFFTREVLSPGSGHKNILNDS